MPCRCRRPSLEFVEEKRQSTKTGGDRNVEPSSDAREPKATPKTADTLKDEAVRP
jgi:hypothetical protein